MLTQKQIDTPKPGPDFNFYRGLAVALAFTALLVALFAWAKGLLT